MVVKFLSHVSPDGMNVYDVKEYLPSVCLTMDAAGNLIVREPGTWTNWAYWPGKLLAIYAAGVWQRVE